MAEILAMLRDAGAPFSASSEIMCAIVPAEAAQPSSGSGQQLSRSLLPYIDCLVAAHAFFKLQSGCARA